MPFVKEWNRTLIDADLEIDSDTVKVAKLSVVEVAPHVEDVGGRVAVQFSSNPRGYLIRGEFLGCEIVVPLISDEGGEDLLFLVFYRERKCKFVAVSDGIATRVSNPKFDTAAIFEGEILPFVPDRHVKTEPVFVFLSVPQCLTAAVNVSGRKIEILI